MLSRRQVSEVVEQLRGVVAAVETGAMECRPEQLAHLQGAIGALEELAGAKPVRDTDV